MNGIYFGETFLSETRHNLKNETWEIESRNAFSYE